MTKLTKIGVQLYTIRDFMGTEEDVKRSFEKLKTLGYDEIQTAGCKIPYATFGRLAKEAGLTVVGSEQPKSDTAAHAGKAGELLKETGVRPVPIHRAYTLDGRYPDVVKALKALAERKMAAIPDCVQMRATGRNRWTLEVWL